MVLQKNQNMIQNDNWKNAKEVLPTFEEKPCIVCHQDFSPQGHWERRCVVCRDTKLQPLKTLSNPKFTGKKSAPQGIRLYEVGGKKKYPSVTSILHPEGIDFPIDQLLQYASRGTLIHKKIEHFHETGKYPTLKELCEVYPGMLAHIKRMKEGSLQLDHKKCNFPGFYEEFGKDFSFDENEIKLISHEHQYAGTADCVGTFRGQPAIIDYKTASDYGPERLGGHFKQLSAYAKASGAPIVYLVVIGLNPKNPKGYEPPLVSEDVEQHFKEFLILRQQFREKYGY